MSMQKPDLSSQEHPSITLAKALEIALPTHPAALTQLMKTTQRTITRRGVIWLGQTCNLRCKFCYFIDKINGKQHPEHVFMSLDKAKKICRTLVEIYGNNAVDIQGGEPTIYSNIYELVSYCTDIGLKPTLITNALVLDEIRICKKYKEAGVRDFLISMHGLGSVYDTLVGRVGAHLRQMKGLRNLQEIGIPFRFNCVLSKPVISQLPFVAELAVKVGARVVNFIAFNPFEDQSQRGRRNSTNVPMYSEVAHGLAEALNILNAADIEANVRYFPLCMIPEKHRKSGYNFQQLPYDHHEWDYASWAWTGMQPQRMKDGETTEPTQPSTARVLIHIKKPFKFLANTRWVRPLLYKAYSFSARLFLSRKSKENTYRKIAKIHAEVHCKYVYGEKCRLCIAKDICDGIHGDYALIFGTEEVRPITGVSPVSDPLHYIRFQQKIVEKEDENRALQGKL